MILPLPHQFIYLLTPLKQSMSCQLAKATNTCQAGKSKIIVLARPPLACSQPQRSARPCAIPLALITPPAGSAVPTSSGLGASPCRTIPLLPGDSFDIASLNLPQGVYAVLIVSAGSAGFATAGGNSGGVVAFLLAKNPFITFALTITVSTANLVTFQAANSLCIINGMITPATASNVGMASATTSGIGCVTVTKLSGALGNSNGTGANTPSAFNISPGTGGAPGQPGQGLGAGGGSGAPGAPAGVIICKAA